MRSLFVLSFCLALISCGGNSREDASNSRSKPNILFVIMDDVGIDQMESFGYGGPVPPRMPNMTAVANSGIRFRNAWSMPECSPGRAAMFVGRYPLRTNVMSALGPYDLANAQLSPYDMTAPKLLKQANYENGFFGKFHLAGPENNEAGNSTPLQLGWDYFYGWIRGGPVGLDTTAGGVASPGTYSCGFVPSGLAGGADFGACYQADNSCKKLTLLQDTFDVGGEGKVVNDVPGKKCMMTGGIFVPRADCQQTPPAGLNFAKGNGYYVSPLVINSAENGVEVIPNTDPRNRGYRTTIETDAAIKWINSRQSGKPWMATVSYSAAHTPFQQPPAALVKTTPNDELSCTDLVKQKLISNKMTEALDSEFGRLLVSTGMATRNADGTLTYNPEAKNTMIVIVGDNGSFANAVKSPFDLTRAKSTAYQTGVWVPLIVAGPLVSSPGRSVEHMTNMVDVFRLFGDLAGLDVTKAVPRVIDSAPMLPYLTTPAQPSVRTVNFTQGSYNLQANGQRNGACLVSTMLGNNVLQTVCTQSVFDKGPCEDNAGVWWGPGYTDPSVIGAPNGQPADSGYRTCWQVNQAEYKSGRPLTLILAETTIAVRNDEYKLVRNTTQTYNPLTDSGGPVTKDEFYQIDQSIPTPKIDTADLDLLPSKSSWQGAVLTNYNSLLASLTSIMASQPACPGDTNMNSLVNAEDLSIWQKFLNWAGTAAGVLSSSIADLNFDGLTNDADKKIINSNLGTCAAPTAVY